MTGLFEQNVKSKMKNASWLIAYCLLLITATEGSL